LARERIASPLLMSLKVRTSTTHDWSQSDGILAADLIESLYITTSANRAAHGKHGYYFATNGDVAWGKIAEVAETRAGARRSFTQEDLDTYFPGLVHCISCYSGSFGFRH
jgi:hypothetical protein